MSTKICPKCNKPIMLPPAISRVDNKTEICSTCGIVEALEIYKKIIEQRMLNVPTVLAKRTATGCKFWCAYCNVFHYHTELEGHVEAKCFNNTPFKKTGYIIQLIQTKRPSKQQLMECKEQN